MASIDDAPVTIGRWIRPRAADAALTGEDSGAQREEESAPRLDAELLRELFSARVRARLAELTQLERQLEDRIRARWEEAESEIRRRRSRLAEEIAARRRQAEATIRAERDRARREGRDEGFRSGFDQGVEEGRRLGREQGRLEGAEEGRREGRLEAETVSRQETRHVIEAFEEGIGLLETERRRLTTEAHEETLALALEIAKKIVHREVESPGDAVLRNVRRAVDLIFRRGRVLLELHPRDLEAVETALERRPRWAEDLEGTELRASEDVGRGGCRLVSGAGTVDLSIATQLELIERALVGERQPNEEAAP